MRTKYTAKMAVQARELASEGLVNKEIARQLRISEDTFYKYVKRYPEFAESLKRGQDVVDDKVESALLKRALGYDVEETKVIADDSGHPVQFIKTKKHIPAEVGAAAFWLKNRRRDAWKDKWDVGVTSDKDIVFNIVSASQQPNSEGEDE